MSTSTSHILELDDYCNLVSLDQPFTPKPSDKLQYTDVLNRVAKFLYKQYSSKRDDGNAIKADDYLARFSDKEKSQLVRSLLTIREPSKSQLPDHIIQDIDWLLQYDLKKKKITEAFELPRVSSIFKSSTIKDDSISSFLSKISIWRGDITTLNADCIVNAANQQMLGCFSPNHRCIDNVIHAQAGPQLRDDMWKIMRHQKSLEPIGMSKVTRGYNLPASYVLHTVGPDLNEDEGNFEEDSENKIKTPTLEQESQLASCYSNCLTLASSLTGVKSVAFCCISTGVFGFPQERAAHIAIDTTKKWLEENQGKTSIELVIFNVFKEEDEDFYLHKVSQLAGCQNHPSVKVNSVNNKILTAVDWLKNADSILIAAGAGMSASAGLDYTSEQVFQTLFPVMHKRGFKCMYQFIGYRDWTPELQWGYILSQVNLARFNWPKTQVYGKLREIAEKIPIDNSSNNNNSEAKKNFFVITSNVDGMFERNDFPVENILTMQGDYAKMQCLKPCSPKSIWPIKPFIDAALPHIDPNTQEITNSDVIPKCPSCGGNVMMNVRGGNWFLEWPYDQKRKEYKDWLTEKVKEAEKKGKLFVILEIGVGFNTPSVIRWPMEAIVAKNPHARLVRVNAIHPEVPGEIADRALGLALDASEVLDKLHEGTKNA